MPDGGVFDVAIVGAGAAGLGATLTLRPTSASCIVLEARPRVGGRAHTVVIQDMPLDVGCGWLHSADRNPFSDLAEAVNLTVDKTPPPWERSPGRQARVQDDFIGFGEALEAFEERLTAGTKDTRADCPATAFFEPGNPWNAAINAFSTYYNGAPFDQVSAQDYAAYSDSGVNWRVREGYGTLIATLWRRATSPHVSVRLNTPVAAVEHGAATLSLETPHGDVHARTAIITVPTPAIAEQRLQFTPPLPVACLAAAGLPLGLADKLFLRLSQPEAVPDNTHIFGDFHRTDTANYHLRPFGRPYIEVYVGGAHAQQMEREGEAAFVAFAVDEIVSVLGSDMRRQLTPLTCGAWGADPWAHGAYSHALPGQADQRARLASPVDERIFFAGEACSAHAFSTAHGAYETGIAAARQALASLHIARDPSSDAHTAHASRAAGVVHR